MSASERLAALVEDQAREGRFPTFPGDDVVLAALPEIVAVVREGERQIAEAHPDDVDLELAAALAALDAKLERE